MDSKAIFNNIPVKARNPSKLSLDGFYSKKFALGLLSTNFYFDNCLNEHNLGSDISLEEKAFIAKILQKEKNMNPFHDKAKVPKHTNLLEYVRKQNLKSTRNDNKWYNSMICNEAHKYGNVNKSKTNKITVEKSKPSMKEVNLRRNLEPEKVINYFKNNPDK